MGGFPSIAELACRKKWFAVKNLIRRQVVPASEFSSVTFGGKTAAGWAAYYMKNELLEELWYYVSKY